MSSACKNKLGAAGNSTLGTIDYLTGTGQDGILSGQGINQVANSLPPTRIRGSSPGLDMPLPRPACGSFFFFSLAHKQFVMVNLAANTRNLVRPGKRAHRCVVEYEAMGKKKAHPFDLFSTVDRDALK